MKTNTAIDDLRHKAEIYKQAADYIAGRDCDPMDGRVAGGVGWCTAGIKIGE